jgi:hypothetical protein
VSRVIDSVASRFGVEMMPRDEFEGDEAEAGAEGEGRVEEPEVGGGQRFVEAADPANERVGGEERLASTQLLGGRRIRGVSSKLAEITQDALRLPHDEQLRLARTLLERSEATGQSDVDGAWEEEIERRIKNIDAGLAKSRPFAEVVAEVDRQLGR